MKKKRNWWFVLLKNKPQNLFRVMKLTFLLCAFFAGSLSATVLSQQRITMQLGETGLKKVFEEIHRQTNKTLIYNDDKLMLEQKVTANFTDVELEELLKQVLEGRNMSFKFVNDYIVIVPQLRREVPQAENTRTIKGLVTDKRGGFLPGVTVRIKDTSVGVSTDQQGEFAIKVPATGEIVLLFTFVGMQPIEVKYNGEELVKVVMEEAVSELNEVVVTTGYQDIKRTRMTGATEVVTAADIANKGYTSIDQALKGQLAGVSTMNITGRPGADAQIRIRGLNSLSGNMDPIWIVDGMPMQGNLPAIGGSADIQNTVLTSGVGNISPDDIATITILKDAAATAIYGSRAANGVIVITTKRGTAGKSVINIQSQVSWEMAPETKLDMMDSQQKIDFETGLYNDFPHVAIEGRVFKILKDRDNGLITADGAAREINRLSQINTNWYDEIFRTAFAHNHTVSLSGGSEKTQYYASINYNNEKGILLNNTYDRLTANLKLTHDFNARLRIFFDISTSLRNDKVSASLINPLEYATFANPFERPYDENGNYEYDRSWDTELSQIREGYKYDINIIKDLNENTQKTRYTSNQLNLKLEYQIVKGLMFSTHGTLSNTNSHSKKEYLSGSYTSKYYAWIKDIYSEKEIPDNMNNGSLEETTSRSQSWTIRNSFQYTGNFADAHYVSVLVGQEASDTQNNNFMNYSPEYFAPYALIGFPDLKGIDAGGLNFNRLGSSTESQDRAVSFFMTASYSYLDKYVIAGSYRLDGADIIGKDNRFSPLWNVSGKWNISEENFMKKLSFIDRLALRVSYGYTGSIDRNAYPFTLLTYSSSYRYQGEKVPRYVTPGNPSIKWQKKQDRSIGMDYSLFNNRVYGTLNYYNNVTKDLLDNTKTAISSGRSSVKANVASLVNRGWEFSITTVNVRTNDFTWSTDLNVSYNKNKVTQAYYKTLYDLPFISRTNRGQRYFLEGNPVQAWYGYHFAGVDPATGNTLGYVKLLDEEGNRIGHLQPDGQYILNMDTEMNSVAVDYLGEAYPPVSGGFGTNFSYKRISLSAQFSFMTGHKIKSFDSYSDNPIYDARYNQLVNQQNRWRKPGDITDIPVYTTSGGGGSIAKYFYDTQIESGNYLKCNNISLGYNLPTRACEKLGIDRARVNFNMQNPFLFTKYRGIDPETLGAFGYPSAKKYIISINIGI